MKELSIEQKAKAYDKALVIAKSRYSIETEESVKICLELMFPELKESADDIMRKMAIKAVYAPEAQSCIKSWGINPDDVIAWLKKQGEQKPDKVEPYPLLTCRDEIDKWLWKEMHLLPGCCSSIEELKYSIAREVAEKLWRNK